MDVVVNIIIVILIVADEVQHLIAGASVTSYAGLHAPFVNGFVNGGIGFCIDIIERSTAGIDHTLFRKEVGFVMNAEDVAAGHYLAVLDGEFSP